MEAKPLNSIDLEAVPERIWGELCADAIRGTRKAACAATQTANGKELRKLQKGRDYYNTAKEEKSIQTV